MQHLSKGRKTFILVEFVIFTVLLQFLICCNLRSFSFPLTWSSSILHSPSLPLKLILTLCHPLLANKCDYLAPPPPHPSSPLFDYVIFGRSLRGFNGWIAKYEPIVESSLNWPCEGGSHLLLIAHYIFCWLHSTFLLLIALHISMQALGLLGGRWWFDRNNASIFTLSAYCTAPVHHSTAPQWIALLSAVPLYWITLQC